MHFMLSNNTGAQHAHKTKLSLLSKLDTEMLPLQPAFHPHTHRPLSFCNTCSSVHVPRMFLDKGPSAHLVRPPVYPACDSCLQPRSPIRGRDHSGRHPAWMCRYHMLETSSPTMYIFQMLSSPQHEESVLGLSFNFKLQLPAAGFLVSFSEMETLHPDPSFPLLALSISMTLGFTLLW